MIGKLRRLRQKLNSIFTGWMPAQDATTLTLRPMPWELTGEGQPNAAFKRHMSALATAGWHADSAQLPAFPVGEAECLAVSGITGLKPFRALTIATHLASFERDGIRLAHLLLTADGMAAGSMVTRLDYSRPVGSGPGKARGKSAGPEGLRTRIAMS